MAKELVRHVATREAALSEVVTVLANVPTLGEVAERMDSRTDDRRTLISRLEHMSRGIQGMNLNTGQDFEGELEALMHLMRTEIAWELSTAIPSIRDLTDEPTRQEAFHSAHHTRRHAPTNLNPNGRRWYERAPLISRLITMYDHMRDFPRASREARVSQIPTHEGSGINATTGLDR